MQSKEAMSLKARISQIAKQNNIAAQAVLQNFFFERFLERLSHSKYRDKFVLKGGMIIAAGKGSHLNSFCPLDILSVQPT